MREPSRATVLLLEFYEHDIFAELAAAQRFVVDNEV
jgi:hypothetical protein